MKKITFFLSILLFTLFSFESFSQTTLGFDGTFQSIASFGAAPRTGSITLSDGKSYTMESVANSTGGNSIITKNGSSQIAYTMTVSHGHFGFKRTDGSEFQLNNINVEFNISNNTKATLSGFKDNNPVPGAVQNITFVQNVAQSVDVSSNTAFDDIDEFRITFNYSIHPDNNATTLLNSIQYSSAVASSETRTIINFEPPTWADVSVTFAQQETIFGGIFTDGDIKFTLSSGDFYLTDNDGVGGTQSFFPTNYANSETLTIESVSGNEFDFQQMFVKVYGTTLNAHFASAEGFKNNVSTGTQSSGTGFVAYSATGGYTVTFNDGVFDDVDKVVITSGTNFGFSNNVMDNVVLGPVPVAGPALTAYIADADHDAIYKVDLNSKSSVTAADQIISGATVSNGVRDLWLDEVSATKKLYFGHNDGSADIIKRANTDGTSIENIITGIAGIRAIAYDAAETMLYWFDDVSDLMYRADISTIPVAQSSAESVAVIVGTQGNNIRDIEIEISGNNITLYAVANNNNESIFKTTIDRDASGALSGATWSTLVTGLTQCSFMALDLNNNFLYFADDEGAGVGNVYRISTSASSTAVSSLTSWNTVAANAPDPIGIDVDLMNNEVYFTTAGVNDDLRKGNLGATSGTTSIALTGFNVPQEIELEVGNPVEVAGDATPPVFESSTPSASSIAQTGFTLATDIDEGGTIYYVVVADGATAPTSANVKAGQSSGAGTPVTSGNTAVSSGGFSNNFSVTGLTASTAYDVYVVAQDGTPNLQVSPTKIDVTTSAPTSLLVAATVFLEGAYNGTGLNTGINSSIPTTQPYSINGHSGGTAGSIPAGAVDWVLVELREAGSAAGALNSTKKGSAAGFLMSDGTIKAPDGTSNLTVNLSGNSGTDYFVVIYHRNHFPIMSASTVAGSGGTLTIDFTSSSANTYQTTTALVSLSGGKFGMPAGDTNNSGSIDGTDLTSWRTNNGAVYSYSGNGVADFNLDGEINAVDRNDFQQKNTAKTRQVPST